VDWDCVFQSGWGVHWVAWAEDLGVETLGEKLWGGSVAMGLVGGVGSLELLLSPHTHTPCCLGGAATATWAGMAGTGFAAAALATASS